METATAESHISDLMVEESQSSEQKYTTSIKVTTSEGDAAVAHNEPVHKPSNGYQTSDIVTTPTEAAAAGDIINSLKSEDEGNAEELNLQAGEGEGPEVKGLDENMGNKISDTGSVTLTHMSSKGEQVPMTDITDGQVQPRKEQIDDLLPATSYTTSTFDGVVKLRLSDSGDAAIKPTTIPSVIHETVQRVPNATALAVKRDGQWIKWTYQQYYTEAKQCAKSMIKLGLEPRRAVGILGFNSPEWFITYLGGIFAGGKSCGIYTTNTAEACEYVLRDCQANVVVVENNIQLQKILKVWENLSHIKAIVQYTGEVAERRENIYSWEEFLNMSKDVPDTELQARLSIQAPNTCCSLIYTSGTTGNPKAVMISHDNCTWTAERAGTKLNYQYGSEILVSFLHLSHIAAQMVDIIMPLRYGYAIYFAQPDALKCTWTAERTGHALKYKYGGEVFVSFLPLSHIAAQMLDILIPLRFGCAVYFAQPDALKGTLAETWKEVRPTGVLAVPRVWEKMQEKMQALGKQSGGIKKRIAAWAKDKGLKGMYAQINGTSLPFGWGIANALVFKKLRAGLGLDRCRMFGSAAAPITKETLEYFASLNIRIDECYGMSESSGPHTFCTDQSCRITSVGKELLGVQTKLDKPDEDGNGEICYWGRHVFMGYLNQEEKTAEAIPEDNWLHSGDIGKKDKDGFLYITGRIKEIIITAGGENIAPVPIEEKVKEALPVVSNCMLIGDKRKFLSMLITLKTEQNVDTLEPLDTLTDVGRDWCKAVGSNAQNVNDALNDSSVLKAIQDGIDKANKGAVSRAACIQKWSILPKDFSLPGGELGPTLKLRRPIVVKKYEKTISAFYEE